MSCFLFISERPSMLRAAASSRRSRDGAILVGTRVCRVDGRGRCRKLREQLLPRASEPQWWRASLARARCARSCDHSHGRPAHGRPRPGLGSARAADPERTERDSRQQQATRPAESGQATAAGSDADRAQSRVGKIARRVAELAASLLRRDGRLLEIVRMRP
jgi:hypothetical protein